MKRRDVLINGGKLAMVIAIGCGGRVSAEGGKFCVDCVHYRTARAGRIWYDQFCGRVELPKVQNPVTGEMEYEDFNDLGGRVLSNQRYPHARKINGDGQCTDFEEKK